MKSAGAGGKGTLQSVEQSEAAWEGFGARISLLWDCYLGISFPSSQEQPGLHEVPGHHQLILETPRVPRTGASMSHLPVISRCHTLKSNHNLRRWQ